MVAVNREKQIIHQHISPMLPESPIELLAPAKDLDCGFAAIHSGADAIYIGAPRFGAREHAGNPISDIAELTAFAHTYWAKVYVTLNTILYDHEINPAVQLAHQLYDVGVDALIIQDFGLLETDLPSIPLIASTQMHNNSVDRIRFLESAGFQRAILARELDLNEIIAIRNATQIELEVFVHGALCISYSGRCYMSYAIGGRSGNRGQCAQPCRRPYDLVDGNGTTLLTGKHLLSLKDLNRLDNLGELLDAGVSSFKIEGRLKDSVYVTNVVSQYRQRLDQLLEPRGLSASSSGHVTYAFTPDLQKTFNRGYTPYFLHNRDILPGAIDTPKMVGECLGRVLDVKGNRIVVKSELSLHPGDGVCWFDDYKALQGTSINKVYTNTLILNENKGLHIGVMLYRNHDHEFIHKISSHVPERKIPVDLLLDESFDGYKLTAEDKDGNIASTTLMALKQQAIKQQQAEKTIRKQLSRMGNTPYQCDHITINCTPAPFIPVAQLNGLRRKTLDALTSVRARNRPYRERISTISTEENYPESHLSYQHNVLNGPAESFLKKHGVQSIEPAVESGMDMSGKTIMRSRQCIRRQLGWCVDKQQITNKNRALFLVDENGHQYPLVFDCAHCEMEVIY